MRYVVAIIIDILPYLVFVLAMGDRPFWPQGAGWLFLFVLAMVVRNALANWDDLP